MCFGVHVSAMSRFFPKTVVQVCADEDLRTGYGKHPQRPFLQRPVARSITVKTLIEQKTSSEEDNLDLRIVKDVDKVTFKPASILQTSF